uniref:NUC173 domain-containing protein n=1 Tax=Caenorhabditis tropicalis TaxID=1561998 RepID=A0A1I7U6Q5_9PELO
MSVKSLTRLLSCEWCQMHLMSDVPAVIEILYVLHRSVLTRDCLATQLQCIECVGSIIDAAQLSMRICASRDISNGNLESADSLRKIPNVLFGGAEGGVDGQIINKDGVKTISYAVLELAVCAIFKQMPQINSAQLKTNSLAALHLRKVGRLPAESTHLVIKSMQILVQIPSLCSPQAKVTVLPVIMYLLIGFVRESARLDEGSIQTDRAGHLSAIAAAAIQSIRNIVSQPPDDETATSWKTIMRNAFYSVLNMSEDNDRIHLDKCIIMLAAVVFTTSAPVDIVLGHQESFNKLIVLLKRHLHSDNVGVLMKTLQSLTSIFGRKGFGGIFVKYLGKEIMPVVKQYTLKVDSENEKINESDLSILQECVKVIEVLALNAKDGKRIQVISLLVQLLVRLLRATSHTEWRKVGPIEKKLHEMAIGRLNAAASVWPTEFKKVIEWNHELKTRLESALLLQSTRHAHQISMAKTQDAKTTPVVQQPRIRLTMFGAENA